MDKSFESINRHVAMAAKAFSKTTPLNKGEIPLCGVDLGTASIIIAALNEAGEPVACEMQPCQVARDGLVVDYMGAIEITRSLVEKLEKRLGQPLKNTAIAVPPGTNPQDSGTHRHIVEAAGLEVTAVLDEPSAANSVLGIKNGVVADIGGGTTGLAVINKGKVVYVADEATGGIHMTLLLMRRHKMTYEQAEEFKQNPKNHAEVYSAVLPVMEKMAGIVKKHIEPYSADEVWLVGGTCCLTGIEKVFTRVLGIETKKPSHPMMVTPLGIALSCKSTPL